MKLSDKLDHVTVRVQCILDGKTQVTASKRYLDITVEDAKSKLRQEIADKNGVLKGDVLVTDICKDGVTLTP